MVEPSTDKGRRRRQQWFALSVVTLALAFGVVRFWPAGQEKHPPTTATAGYADIEDSVRAAGTLLPLRKVDVGARVSGQLQTLRVELGRSVRKGDLLATIDPTIAQNEVESNEAGLVTADAELESRRIDLEAARRERDRQRILLKADAAPRADLERAEDETRKLEAQVRQLDARLQQARLATERSRANLAYTGLHAPMDGEVVAIAVQEGQTINATQQVPTVVTLARLDQMTAKIQIPEADIGRVHVGQKAYFTTLGDPARRYYGTLRAIQPTGEKVHDALFFNALFDVANPKRALWPDMTVQASAVAEERTHILAIPFGALGEKEADGRYAIEVVGTDGKRTERKIRTGIDDRVMVQVIDGLAAGEKVVVRDVTPAPPQAAMQFGVF